MVNERINEWMNEWMDEWMDGWINEWIFNLKVKIKIKLIFWNESKIFSHLWIYLMPSHQPYSCPNSNC